MGSNTRHGAWFHAEVFGNSRTELEVRSLEQARVLFNGSEELELGQCPIIRPANEAEYRRHRKTFRGSFTVKEVLSRDAD